MDRAQLLKFVLRYINPFEVCALTYDIKAREYEDLVAQGVEAQVDYAIRAYGLRWVREYFAKAFEPTHFVQEREVMEIFDMQIPFRIPRKEKCTYDYECPSCKAQATYVCRLPQHLLFCANAAGNRNAACAGHHLQLVRVHLPVVQE